jgi:hypothetical protein
MFALPKIRLTRGMGIAAIVSLGSLAVFFIAYISRL